MRGLEWFAVAVPVPGIAQFAACHVELLAHIAVGIPAGPGTLWSALAEKSLCDHTTFYIDTLCAAGIGDGIAGHIGEAVQEIRRAGLLDDLPGTTCKQPTLA